MSDNTDNKRRAITFWLCHSEYEQLNAAVDRTGLSRSDYLRLFVRGERQRR